MKWRLQIQLWKKFLSHWYFLDLYTFFRRSRRRGSIGLSQYTPLVVCSRWWRAFGHIRTRELSITILSIRSYIMNTWRIWLRSLVYLLFRGQVYWSVGDQIIHSRRILHLLYNICRRQKNQILLSLVLVVIRSYWSSDAARGRAARWRALKFLHWKLNGAQIYQRLFSFTVQLFFIAAVLSKCSARDALQAGLPTALVIPIYARWWWIHIFCFSQFLLLFCISGALFSLIVNGGKNKDIKK